MAVLLFFSTLLPSLTLFTRLPNTSQSTVEFVTDATASTGSHLSGTIGTELSMRTRIRLVRDGFVFALEAKGRATAKANLFLVGAVFLLGIAAAAAAVHGWWMIVVVVVVVVVEV